MHRHFYRWHRFFGAFAALITVILALTGIALNHTQQLRLAERYVSFSPLLDWYGIKAAESGVFQYLDDDLWLGQVGKPIYLNSQVILEQGQFHGAVRVADWLLVWLDDGLVLLQPDGTVLEQFSTGLPQPIRDLGLDAQQRVVLKSDDGWYRADVDIVQWEKLTTQIAVQWHEAEAWPTQLLSQLQARSRLHIVSWERLLLDIHSARILGAAGVYVLDVFAILLAIMAISGLAMWLRRWG